MRKVFLFVLLLAVLVSCTLDNSVSEVGFVSFDSSVSRGVTAYIEYPSLLDKTWTLQAEKLDGKSSTGAGQYDNIVLTDTVGPFSVGQWRFTITDSENSVTGSVIANITAGNNNISITVHSKASNGTLSLEECNFLKSKIGEVLYIDLYIDEERVNTPWTKDNFITEDGNYYLIPTATVQLSEGIHSVRFYYGTDAGGVSSETINIRVVKGMITHFTLGEQEGNMVIAVSFDEVEALVL